MSQQRITTTALNVIETLFTNTAHSQFDSKTIQTYSINSFLKTSNKDKRDILVNVFRPYPYLISNIKRVDTLQNIYKVELSSIIDNIECLATIQIQFTGYYYNDLKAEYINYFTVQNVSTNIIRKRVV